MKIVRAIVIILLLSFTIFVACDDSDSKFGPPISKPKEEPTQKPVERDKDGWVTEKDLSAWEKETHDPAGNVVITQDEMRGMKLFMRKCNRCHPAGEKGKGPALNDKKLPDMLIHFQIRNGLGDMPAFKEKDISKEDVKRIISFVRLIRKNDKS
jgi:mono/diheme cytochrome c family protein